MKVTKGMARTFIAAIYAQDDPRPDDAVKRALEAALADMPEPITIKVGTNEAALLLAAYEKQAAKLAKVRKLAENNRHVFGLFNKDILEILDEP